MGSLDQPGRSGHTRKVAGGREQSRCQRGHTFRSFFLGSWHLWPSPDLPTDPPAEDLEDLKVAFEWHTASGELHSSQNAGVSEWGYRSLFKVDVPAYVPRTFPRRPPWAIATQVLGCMLWGQKRLGKLASALRISHKRGNHTTELGPKKSMSVGSTERDDMTSSLIPFHLLLLHLSPTYGSGWCLSHCSGFPGGTSGKEPACWCWRWEMRWDESLIPGLGRSPGGVNGNPPQYSCLENPIDRGAWWATVYGVAKSRTFWTLSEPLKVKWMNWTSGDFGRSQTSTHSMLLHLPGRQAGSPADSLPSVHRHWPEMVLNSAPKTIPFKRECSTIILFDINFIIYNSDWVR